MDANVTFVTRAADAVARTNGSHAGRKSVARTAPRGPTRRAASTATSPVPVATSSTRAPTGGGRSVDERFGEWMGSGCGIPRVAFNALRPLRTPPVAGQHGLIIRLVRSRRLSSPSPARLFDAIRAAVAHRKRLGTIADRIPESGPISRGRLRGASRARVIAAQRSRGSRAVTTRWLGAVTVA